MKNRFSSKKKNTGTTLVEIIVTFALLGIFLAASAAIIGLISNQYFHVKGETYSKQVTDILMEKVSSEIEGAKYLPSATGEEDANPDYPQFADDYKSISIYDRTDTKVTLSASDGELLLDYAGFTDNVNPSNSRNATTWKFDQGVYNGYTLEELYFVRGDQLGSFMGNVTGASDFGLTSGQVSYGKDITVVFLKLNSAKYGDYYTYRVVKMYNVEDTASSTTEPTG